MARFMGCGSSRPVVFVQSSNWARLRTCRERLPSCKYLSVTVALVLLIVSTCTVPALWAQSEIDQAHVKPLVDPAANKAKEPLIDPALKTHTRPLKVDVDLVLIPVTI